MWKTMPHIYNEFETYQIDHLGVTIDDSLKWENT